jgi:hypothetical protein
LLPVLEAPLEQAAPSAMHMPAEQQPLEHVLPAQQGAPTVPHSWQMPAELELVEHTVPPPHRAVPLAPEQHCSPAWPQDEHMLLRQARPSLHEVPQHGCPDDPQPEHLPALHRPGLVPPVPPVPIELEQATPSATQVSL